jgi:hypothetical protein
MNEKVLNIEPENKKVKLMNYNAWYRKHNKHKIKQHYKDTYKKTKKIKKLKIKVFTIKIQLIDEF